MLTKRRGAGLPARFAGEQLTCGGGHSLVSGPTVEREGRIAQGGGRKEVVGGEGGRRWLGWREGGGQGILCGACGEGALSFFSICPERVQGLLSLLVPCPCVELTGSRGSLVNTRAERSPLGGR